MELHIINLKHRSDRLNLLKEELAFQEITNYKLWEGILDTQGPKAGIGKAHKQIVKWAKKLNLESIVTAEDDIIFTDKGAYNYFIEHTPLEYDLYLGGIYYGHIENDRSVPDFSGLTLYRIHQRFYDKFLSCDDLGDLDRQLAAKGKFIVCDPFVVKQRVGFSDNILKYIDYDPYLEGRKFFKR